MPNYDTLDTIADAYTPLLALLWLALAAWPLTSRRWRLAGMRVALGIASLAVCYTLMFADKAFGIWPALGLDYSTHSAVAIAFVAIHCTLLPRLRMLWLASLLAYFGLMRYQGYHSVADIVTTSAVIAPLLIWLCVRFAGAAVPANRIHQHAALRPTRPDHQ